MACLPLNETLAATPRIRQLRVKKHLNRANVRKTLLVLRSVNHKLRQTIIDVIERNPRVTVTDIYIKLRLEQCVVSQHLRILRAAKVVITEKNGKYIHYSVNFDRLNQIAEMTASLAE